MPTPDTSDAPSINGTRVSVSQATAGAMLLLEQGGQSRLDDRSPTLPLVTDRFQPSNDNKKQATNVSEGTKTDSKAEFFNY